MGLLLLKTDVIPVASVQRIIVSLTTVNAIEWEFYVVNIVSVEIVKIVPKALKENKRKSKKRDPIDYITKLFISIITFIFQ